MFRSGYPFSVNVDVAIHIALNHFTVAQLHFSVSAGVIDRWELIQAQALSKELRMKQNLQQWQQFNSDLNNIWAWLGETEEDLEKLRCLNLSTDLQTIELRIKKLKVGFISVFSQLLCK